MNIIFFGSSRFAVPSLRELHARGYNISCVVTQPDKKRGRGLKVSYTPVKETAQELKLKVFQPTSVKDAETVQFLKNLEPDLLVVIAYGKILPGQVLNIPKMFSINLHASLLPKYRGAAPINWAIINGEERSGVTIIKINEQMDEGDIISRQEVKLSKTDTAELLEEKLSLIGAKLTLDTVNSIKKHDFTITAQDNAHATYAPKLSKNNGLIDWSKPAANINDLIRGAIPWPGAFTHYRSKILKIHSAQAVLCGISAAPGEIISATSAGILVATGKDHLSLQEMQIEGKRRMPVKEFLAGHKVTAGEILK